MAKRILALWLALALLCSVLLVATTADSIEDDLLGSISQQYESNGDPGRVSSGDGDLGGASYGAYQFAGNMDVPLTFAKWCVSSGEGKTVGNQLIAAYKKDGNAFDKNFKAEWQAIAKENPDAFYRLQRLYVKEKYYVPAVNALKKYLNLDVEQYGIAFKNAVWSRTIQHGLGSYSTPSGFLGIMKQVEKTLPNGLAAATEQQLITAIYEESGKVVKTGTNPMETAYAGGNAWIIDKYNLEGKYMKYYSGNSAAVQAGVYLRLRVNELADLLEMLNAYGGYMGLNQYGTITPSFSGTTMVLTSCDAFRGWNADKNTTLLLDAANKKYGSSSLTLTVDSGQTNAGATLHLNGATNLSGFTVLTAEIYLAKKQTSQSANLTVEFMQQQTVKHTAGWALTALPAGWHTVTIALPNAIPVEQIDKLRFGFSDVNGTKFAIDQIKAQSTDPQKTMQVATVQADFLNCRSGVSTDHPVVGQFTENTGVVVIGREVDGWVYCSGTDADGRALVGWCSSEYLVISPFQVHSGDVDAGGKVGAEDALMILQSVVGKIKLTAAQKATADVNYDGKVNANDAMDVLKIVVNKQ